MVKVLQGYLRVKIGVRVLDGRTHTRETSQPGAEGGGLEACQVYGFSNRCASDFSVCSVMSCLSCLWAQDAAHVLPLHKRAAGRRSG